MVAVSSQACPAAAHYCCESQATGAERIDSRSWNLQVEPTISVSAIGEFEQLNVVRRKEAKLLAAVAAGGLMLSPALAATSSGAKKKPAAIA